MNHNRHSAPPGGTGGGKGWLRPLLVWVGLLVTLLLLFGFMVRPRPPENLIYPKTGQTGGETGGMDALAYLNHLRGEAGLGAFARSPELTRSAAAHADYLTDFPEDMHDENHPESRFFSGKELGDRVKKTGYQYLGAQENVSTVSNSEPVGKTLQQHLHLDGLMTAIYHRFSLLDANSDEAGIGYTVRNGNHAFVVNQGNSRANKRCGQTKHSEEDAEEYRSFYSSACQNGGIIYADEVDIAAPDYVAYPVGKRVATMFANETPNPLPDRKFSGNPVSIAFNEEGDDEIEMLSFELFKGKEKVGNTRILDAETDPNKLFTPYQFALFPLDPLAYDTEYRAVFRYAAISKEDGLAREKKVEWTFRTRKPNFDYFNLQGGENMAVQAGKPHYLRWPLSLCNGDCNNVSYSSYGDAELVIHESLPDGVVVSVKGSRGSGVRLVPEGKSIPESALLIQ